MNIDIFSHSSSFGGAESALYALIRSLKIEHQLRVFLPKLKGEFHEILTAAHIQVLQHKFVSALPHAQRMLDQQLFENGRESVAAVRNEVTDLILCNTLTLPHVVMYAQSIAVPCIVYAHEFIDGDPDLAPNGCSPSYYLKQIEKSAAHILCASEFVARQFSPTTSSVLYPFQNGSINQAEQKKSPLQKTSKNGPACYFYRLESCISESCWQSATSRAEKISHSPLACTSHCKCVVLNRHCC